MLRGEGSVKNSKKRLKTCRTFCSKKAYFFVFALYRENEKGITYFFCTQKTASCRKRLKD